MAKEIEAKVNNMPNLLAEVRKYRTVYKTTIINELGEKNRRTTLKDGHLSESYAVYTGKSLPAFQRFLLPSSSGSLPR
jgi:hypothetical protein